MRTSGELTYFSRDSFRLNRRKGGEIVQLVLDHGKLKSPDIYRLLQGNTPNLRKLFALPSYSWPLNDPSDVRIQGNVVQTGFRGISSTVDYITAHIASREVDSV